MKATLHSAGAGICSQLLILMFPSATWPGLSCPHLVHIHEAAGDPVSAQGALGLGITQTGGGGARHLRVRIQLGLDG